MTDIVLSQNEADNLLSMIKHCVDKNEYDFPTLGGSLMIPLISDDKKENFHLDIWRNKIEQEVL